MIRLLLTCLLSLSLLCEISSGQIDLSYTKAKSLVGATNPRVIGERILIGEDSKPQVVTVAVIKVQSTERVRLKARKSLFEFAELVQLSDTEFLLAGEGEYLIEAISFSWDASVKIQIGENPKPPEPDPIDPDPPQPDIDVPNAYNVGKVAFQTAAKDPATAKKLAASYKAQASKLFGQGGLSDIESILKQLNLEIVSQGDKWKPFNDSVSKALKAEQVKRGSFSRQDWYSALNEIATALEVSAK